MAGVFLSYDRDDSAAAKVIATALEKLGHSVWWDLHVRGGAQFAKVIEEALKAADAVVVLWSKDSIDSAWVRDEAAAGRDSGRLIPATIDGTEAPLGFRQFQVIDLTDWKRGARSRGFNQLAGAIQDAAPASRSQAHPAPPEPWRPINARTGALVGSVVIAAIATGAYLLWPSPSAAVPTVTVVPASTSPLSQSLSRDLLAKLGVLQASNSQALQLVEDSGGKSPDLIFKVDGSSEAGASKATLLLLSGKNRELLWSGDFAPTTANPADLKQQLAYGAANILECASDAYGPQGRSLDEPTRRLYLSGCGAFTQVSGADLESLVRTFREVTRRAPKFEGGWSRLLNAENELFFNPPFDHDTPENRASVKADIAAARRINPDLAEAYGSEAQLAFERSSIQSVRLLELAAQKNPDNAGAISSRSLALLQVGRMSEAVSDARKALQMQPFSPRAEEQYISALTYAGQLEAAERELARAESLFPGASNLADVKYRLNLRYGSAEEALKQLQSDETQIFPGQIVFLKARVDPTPANVNLAVEGARKRLDGTSITAADYVQTLAAFGRKDELFDYLLSVSRTDQRGGFVGVLFRPAFRDFWRDPRFMQVAARFGLIDYWRQTGHWPDFCSDPQLPYDCKKEAAKLKA